MSKRSIGSVKYKWILTGASIGLLLVGPMVVAMLNYDFLNHSQSFENVLLAIYKRFIWEIDFESILTGIIFLVIGSSVGYLMYRFRKTKYNEDPELSAGELIKKGESDRIEFKASYRWDLHQNKISKEVELAVLKTIAAFLNSLGGTLLIGVSDDGSVVGLENDYKTLKRKDRDGFAQFIAQSIALSLGADTSTFINVSFVSMKEKDVSVIKVEKAMNPVFLKRDGSTSFYIRAGNTTRELDVEETLRYITGKFNLR